MPRKPSQATSKESSLEFGPQLEQFFHSVLYVSSSGWDAYLEAERADDVAGLEGSIFALEPPPEDLLEAFELLVSAITSAPKKIWKFLAECIQSQPAHLDDDQPLPLHAVVVAAVVGAMSIGDPRLSAAAAASYLGLLAATTSHEFLPRPFVVRQVVGLLGLVAPPDLLSTSAPPTPAKRKVPTEQQPPDDDVAIRIIFEFKNYFGTQNVVLALGQVSSREGLTIAVEKMLALATTKQSQLGRVANECLVRLFEATATLSGDSLVPLFDGGPPAPPLLVAASLVFLPLVGSLAMGGRKVGTAATCIPKDLQDARRCATELVVDIINAAPALINPSELCPEGELVVSLEIHSNAQKAVSSEDEGPMESDEELEIKKIKKKESTKSKKSQFVADDPIIGFLTQTAIAVPDRKEWRDKFADSVVCILDAADSLDVPNPPFDPNVAFSREWPLHCRFLSFLCKFISSDRLAQRILGIELGSRLLARQQVLSSLDDSSSTTVAQLAVALFNQIIASNLDPQPTARAKSVDSLASLIARTNWDTVGRLSSLQTLPPTNANGLTGTIPALLGILLASLTDVKPVVRRSALGLVEGIAAVVDDAGIIGTLNWGREGCRVSDGIAALACDPGLQVRQRALGTINLLLERFPNARPCVDLWLQNVLPAIGDPEPSVVERCLDLIVVQLLLDRLPRDLAAGEGPSRSLVEQSMDHDNLECLQRALAAYIRTQGLGSVPYSTISTYIRVMEAETTKSPDRWVSSPFVLLTEVAAAARITKTDLSKKIAGTVAAMSIKLWDKVASQTAKCLDVSQRILGLLLSSAQQLTAEERKRLSHDLKHRLLKLSFPLPIVRDACAVLFTLVDFDSISGDLLDTVKANLNVSTDPEPLCVALAILGELAPKIKTPTHLLAFVQAAATGSLAQLDPGCGPTPSIVRATAFVTLGRLCLSSEPLTKKQIETFVYHLGPSEENMNVRNNALVAVADVCETFTSIVDRYVPHLTAILSEAQAAHPLLRKQALALLASLVTNDYVKFRGQIVYRFMYTIADPHPLVRSLAEAIFVRIVMKQPTCIQQHFLGSVCMLNNWHTHPNFRPMESVVATRGRELAIQRDFVAAPIRRQKIYIFLMRLMSDRDKLEVSRRIVNQFLALFVDSQENEQRPVVPLPTSTDEPAGAALRDVLRLLCCKQLKITFGTEEPATGTTATATATTAMSSDQLKTHEDEEEEKKETKKTYEANLLKRNLAVQILPTLLSLKKMMENAKSPLLRDILKCLGCLLYDYRSDLPEILVSDPMLIKQLEFDFRRGTYTGLEEFSLDDPNRKKFDIARPSLALDPTPAGPRPMETPADGRPTIPKLRLKSGQPKRHSDSGPLTATRGVESPDPDDVSMRTPPTTYRRRASLPPSAGATCVSSPVAVGVLSAGDN